MARCLRRASARRGEFVRERFAMARTLSSRSPVLKEPRDSASIPIVSDQRAPSLFSIFTKLIVQPQEAGIAGPAVSGATPARPT